jgi:cytochrome c biogenesis protein CcmG, thiol:disulfide interchange protein DsbE
MRRFMVPGLITLVVVALLAVLAYGVSQSGPGNSLAAKVHRGEAPVAPNASMPLQLLGSSQRETLDRLHGRVVMVNVFAGWCVACQDEVAVLKRSQQLLARHGGEMVGVTFQDSSSDAASYMRRYGLRYPVLLDPAGSFVAPYGVTGVPETFVIGRDGRVVAADTAQMTQQWADQALNRALGSST